MDVATIAPTSARLDLVAPPPLVVLALGAAVAPMVQLGMFAPDLISLDDHGNVVVRPCVPGPRWWAPELRRSIDDVDEKSPAAAVWSLGRFLLELALGRRVDDHIVVTLDQTGIAALVDVQGRPVSPRLAEVLAALLAPDPAHRLQSTRAAARVCADAAARFGDVDTALTHAAGKRLPRVTADLPARDILSPGELVSLRAQAAAAGLDGRPAQSAAQPMLATSAAAALVDDRSLHDDNDDNDDNDDDAGALTPVPQAFEVQAVAVVANQADDEQGDLDRFTREQRREHRMAAAVGALVLIVVVAGFVLLK